MNSNPVFKFDGPVTVVIRAKDEYVLDGETYAANQPITVLENIFPILDYAGESKQTSNPNIGMLFVYKHTFPMILTLSAVPLSKKVTGMLFNKKENFRSGAVQKIDRPLNSTIFLPSNHLEVQEIFVYKNELLSTYTYNSETNSITLLDYDANSNYKIFYTYKNAAKSSWNLTSTRNPYFSIEMYGKMNVDNLTSNVYLYFEKCSLNPQSMINFAGSYENIALTFYIMEGSENYFVIG